MLIHKVKVQIGVKDLSEDNFDSTFKRPKGDPPETLYTVWGQNNADNQQRMDPQTPGDAARIDGYLYLEKPLAQTFQKGDRIREIDGRTFDAEIVEVRDESAYGHGHRLVRLDYKRNWDV